MAKRRTSAWSIRRDTTKRKLKQLGNYPRFTGEVMWAWNTLQTAYLDMFLHVVSPRNGGRVALAIWHTVISDQAQRDMLEAAIEYAWRSRGLEKRALANIKWALQQTRFLTAYRNIAAHMPVTTSYLGAGQSETIADPHYSKWSAQVVTRTLGHQFIFEHLVFELSALASYVEKHVNVLYEVSPGEFPRKPRLRLHKLCLKAMRQAGPPKELKLRPRQRAIVQVDIAENERKKGQSSP